MRRIPHPKSHSWKRGFRYHGYSPWERKEKTDEAKGSFGETFHLKTVVRTGVLGIYYWIEVRMESEEETHGQADGSKYPVRIAKTLLTKTCSFFLELRSVGGFPGKSNSKTKQINKEKSTSSPVTQAAIVPLLDLQLRTGPVLPPPPPPPLSYSSPVYASHLLHFVPIITFCAYDYMYFLCYRICAIRSHD